MRLHLAAVTTYLNYKNDLPIHTYTLETYLALKNKIDLNWIENDYFILDSGAYTFMRGNKGDIDWNKYIEEYAGFILNNNIKFYFELDIDKIIGLKEVEKLTDKLYQLTNIKPIPVWHIDRGLEYYDYMINNYPYIALSAAGNNFSSEWTRTKEGYSFIDKLVNKALIKKVKVHALGFTHLEQLNKIKFYSCDSTGWLFGSKFGKLFTYSNGKIIHTRPTDKRIKQKEATINNFEEWKKLQDYYLTK